VSYTTIGGNGAAASLSISGNVLLTGQIAVAGQVAVAPTTGQPTTSLALDGGRLTAASAAIAGTVSIGKAGSATVSGNATLTGGTLLALNGSAVKVGGLIGNGSNNAIAIDANSSIQIGSSTKIAGALTQAAGTTAALSGAIYGAVNTAGTLAVAGGGSLFIDMTNGAANDPYATTLPTISGSGTLVLTEGSTLGLGVTDSVAISFAGPNATLVLAALPTATITGFAAGDTIVVDKTVTGLSYTQGTGSGTLTLTNGATTVGKLTLAGTYNSSTTAFHLDTATDGSSATISLQSLGIAATQPTLIQGTAAIDLLTATAAGQTLTGLGGGDTLSGGQFTGIAFKDLTANLNGDTIQNFVASDLFDFTDMVATKATATYAGGFLSVTDGTHAAKVGVGFLGTPSSGSFTVAADGAGGTKVTWH
ncbi:MAG: beta strand repeat-containing protein, partial [Rhodopila sp.]